MSANTEINTGKIPPINQPETESFRATDEFREDAHFSSLNQYKSVYEFSVTDKE
ncbi:MAG: hypothetical protein H6Q27_1360, partial [Ignavibacteriaceae bacterium]|nr:hypothetical protein [Ignavibacteriaceae bacterium]